MARRSKKRSSISKQTRHQNDWGEAVGCHFKEFLASLYNGAASGDRSSDCVFKAPGGTREHRLHKLVLCHYSPVFRAMLSGDFREASASHKAIVLEETTDGVLDAAFKSLYGISWPDQDDIPLLLDLWEFGHRYGIRFLEKMAAAQVLDLVSVSNVDSALNMARTLGSREYHRKFFKWIGRNLDSFVRNMSETWPEPDGKSKIADWFQSQVSISELDGILCAHRKVRLSLDLSEEHCDPNEIHSTRVSIATATEPGEGTATQSGDASGSVSHPTNCNESEKDNADDASGTVGTTGETPSAPSRGARDRSAIVVGRPDISEESDDEFEYDSDVSAYEVPRLCKSTLLVFNTICFWADGNLEERRCHVDELFDKHLALDDYFNEWMQSSKVFKVGRLPSILSRMINSRVACNSAVLMRMIGEVAISSIGEIQRQAIEEQRKSASR